MSLIISNVSQLSRPYSLGSRGRLSASSAFPRSLTGTIKNTRSKKIFKALKQGLEDRHITVSRQATMEVYSTQTRKHWHLKSRTPLL